MTTALAERILESMPLGLVVIDRDLNVVRYNESAARIMGLPEEQVIGANIDLVFRPHSQERMIQITVEKGIEFKDYEVQLDVQGQSVWILINTRIMKDEAGEVIGATMIFSDITTVKEMELNLVRSARLVMIGEMAAGAAHEIRNPLTVIKGFLQLWQQQNDHPFLPLLFGEIEQIDRIIQQFLLLSKKQGSHLPGFDQKGAFDLQDSIHDLGQLCLSEAILKDIRFDVVNEAGPLPVEMNRLECKQILVNLIRNAFDAFPSAHGDKHVEIHVRRRRSHASIWIVDNGAGMSRMVLHKVSNAFFTTKESGTGLGLAICRQLAARNGCRFRLYSREGSGTVVVLQVPFASPQPELEKQPALSR
jgi:two-component system, sporulation sensor kinase E